MVWAADPGAGSAGSFVSFPRRISRSKALSPLHETAIVYRQADPYAPMVREALDLGIRVVGSPKVAASPKAAWPGTHGVITVPERGSQGARSSPVSKAFAVLARDSGLLPEASSWERLSRAANVVRGTPVGRATHVAGRGRSGGARAPAPRTGAPSTDATVRRQLRSASTSGRDRRIPPTARATHGGWSVGAIRRVGGGIV